MYHNKINAPYGYTAAERILVFQRLAATAATIVIAAISEYLARHMYAPATIFLAVSLIPLVPGSGLYDTMEYCISSQTMLASTTGLHTLGIAAALAMGIVVVSSTVRILSLHESKSAKN